MKFLTGFNHSLVSFGEFNKTFILQRTNKGSGYVREYFKPYNPRTLSQQSHRDIFRQVRGLYNLYIRNNDYFIELLRFEALNRNYCNYYFYFMSQYIQLVRDFGFGAVESDLMLGNLVIFYKTSSRKKYFDRMNEIDTDLFIRNINVVMIAVFMQMIKDVYGLDFVLGIVCDISNSDDILILQSYGIIA